ncbi:MAG: type II secretion system F family protein [Bacillota bacterium]
MVLGWILSLAVAAWACALAGMACLARSHRERLALQERLGAGRAADPGADAVRGVLLTLADRCRPLVPRLLDPAGREGLAALLERAGRPWGLEVEDLVALQAGLGLAGLALAGLMVVGGVAGPHLLPALPLLGWLAPGWVLGRAAAARQRQMARALPDFLDLLAVSLGAGCALDPALDALCRHFSGPLAEEFRRYLQETALGVPRGQALSHLLARTDCPELRWLCDLLGQGLELGTPLAGALAAQARDLRATRLARVREEAGYLRPRLTLVTTFLVTPGVLLFLLGLIVLNIWYHPETLGLGPLVGP